MKNIHLETLLIKSSVRLYNSKEMYLTKNISYIYSKYNNENIFV